MEGKFGGKLHNLYGPLVSSFKAPEKKNLESDLNDCKWNGDLFTATSLNVMPSDCRSRQLFPDVPKTSTSVGLSHSSSCSEHKRSPGNEKGKRKLHSRKKVDDDEVSTDVEHGCWPMKVRPAKDGWPKGGCSVRVGKRVVWGLGF
ncbi:hypothetical protein GQ457_01G024210 [Hibiscus cannabinus]